MKKIILTLLVTISLLLCLSINALATNDVTVNINNEAVVFDQKPIIENGRTLVPIRAIAEKMLFDVNWEQSTQKITLENFNTILTLYVNGTNITKELKHASTTYKDKLNTISLDVPARIIDGRTYVPLRAISELFGATVDWDAKNYSANISYDLTYGKVIEFKDEGIEYLCRLAITLKDIDTTNYENLKSTIQIDIWDDSFPIYDGIIYEGAIKDITTLGLNKETVLPNRVNSIEDISKFPNLKNIYLLGQNISDLSPITYKDSWNEIDVYQNPIFDFTSLKDIQVNHFIYAGYFNYIFSYINNDYTNNPTPSNSENERYNLFAENLVKIFSTMQNVIKENITPDMTRKEKLEVVNNWIISNIEYDYDSKYFNNIKTFYTTLDPLYYMNDPQQIECAILHGKAICDGYSMVFDIFCDMLEIPSIELVGNAFNEQWLPHSWNVVELEDGKLYHVDTTWNCANNIYFLTDDESISKDHQWMQEDINLIFNAKKQRIPFLQK